MKVIDRTGTPYDPVVKDCDKCWADKRLGSFSPYSPDDQRIGAFITEIKGYMDFENGYRAGEPRTHNFDRFDDLYFIDRVEFDNFRQERGGDHYLFVYAKKKSTN